MSQPILILIFFIIFIIFQRVENKYGKMSSNYYILTNLKLPM